MGRVIGEHALEILPSGRVLAEPPAHHPAVVTRNHEARIDQQKLVELEEQHLEIGSRQQHATPHLKSPNQEVFAVALERKFTERKRMTWLLPSEMIGDSVVKFLRR